MRIKKRVNSASLWWSFAGASSRPQRRSPLLLVGRRPFRHASDVDSIRKSKSPRRIHPFIVDRRCGSQPENASARPAFLHPQSILGGSPNIPVSLRIFKRTPKLITIYCEPGNFRGAGWKIRLVSIVAKRICGV